MQFQYHVVSLRIADWILMISYGFASPCFPSNCTSRSITSKTAQLIDYNWHRLQLRTLYWSFVIPFTWDSTFQLMLRGLYVSKSDAYYFAWQEQKQRKNLKRTSVFRGTHRLFVREKRPFSHTIVGKVGLLLLLLASNERRNLHPKYT